jgi:hypothetical protein
MRDVRIERNSIVVRPECEDLRGSCIDICSCWNFRRLCERAQCARYPDSRYIYCICAFFGVFCLYPVLFCSLQYIYEYLYRSYLSVCLWCSQRQPEILSLSYHDHAKEYTCRFDFNNVRTGNLISSSLYSLSRKNPRLGTTSVGLPGFRRRLPMRTRKHTHCNSPSNFHPL